MFIFLFVFCGKKKSTGPDINEIINSLINEGWSLYSSKDYSNAVIKFGEIFKYDNTNTDAYIGVGWCYARLAFGSGDQKYNLAQENFEKALVKEPDNLDALAGLALVLIVKNHYEDAINAAQSVLEKDSNYVFKRDNQISAGDLILILAQAYYYLGNYEKAADQLDIIDPGNYHPANKPETLLTQIQALWGNV